VCHAYTIAKRKFRLPNNRRAFFGTSPQCSSSLDNLFPDDGLTVRGQILASRARGRMATVRVCHEPAIETIGDGLIPPGEA